MRFRKAIGIICLSVMVGLGCNDDPSEPTNVDGSLEVSITVTGAIPDPDSFAVMVSLEGRGELPSETVESNGGTARFARLPAGNHSVSLELRAANCSVDGTNPRPFTILAGETTSIRFSVSCPRQRLAGVFERVTPHSDAAEAYHGSLSERYVFQQDGTFSLQFTSERHGSFEYGGTYSLSGAEIVFDFDADSRWLATGTLRPLQDGCMTVEYNAVMLLSDFEDGEYCLSVPDASGALEVSITVTGKRPDPDGYAVVVNLQWRGDLPAETVAPTGGTVRFPGLPAAGFHSVRLESLAANCWIETDNPRRFTVHPGETTSIGFSVSCPGPPDMVFERVNPDSEYHGSLSERYVIGEDGTFRLQFNSARHGFFEYTGIYSRSAAQIVFDFDASNRAGDWQATGTVRGNCLTIEYNIVMWLADFRDGEYCQPPGP